MHGQVRAAEIAEEGSGRCDRGRIRRRLEVAHARVDRLFRPLRCCVTLSGFAVSLFDAYSFMFLNGMRAARPIATSSRRLLERQLLQARSRFVWPTDGKETFKEALAEIRSLPPTELDGDYLDAAIQRPSQVLHEGRASGNVRPEARCVMPSHCKYKARRFQMIFSEDINGINKKTKEREQPRKN